MPRSEWGALGSARSARGYHRAFSPCYTISCHLLPILCRWGPLHRDWLPADRLAHGGCPSSTSGASVLSMAIIMMIKMKSSLPPFMLMILMMKMLSSLLISMMMSDLNHQTVPIVRWLLEERNSDRPSVENCLQQICDGIPMSFLLYFPTIDAMWTQQSQFQWSQQVTFWTFLKSGRSCWSTN